MDKIALSAEVCKQNFDKIINDYKIPEYRPKPPPTALASMPRIGMIAAAPLLVAGALFKKTVDDVPDDVLNVEDRKFYDLICQYCDERNITEPELYNRAGLSRAIYSKIRNMGVKGNSYKPSKETVLQLCIAFPLSVAQTQELLWLVGYTLSNNIVIDKIIAWCLAHSEKYHFTVNSINDIIYDKIGVSPFNKLAPN